MSQPLRKHNLKRIFWAIPLSILSGIIIAYAGAVFGTLAADPSVQFLIVFVTIFLCLFGTFALWRGLGFALGWVSLSAATVIVIGVAIAPTPEIAGSITLSSLALGGTIAGVIYLAAALSLSQFRMMTSVIFCLGLLFGAQLGVLEQESVSGFAGVIFLGIGAFALAIIISDRTEKGDRRYRLILDFIINLSIRRDVAIFLSYRRKDSAEMCDRIYHRLIQNFGPGSIFKDIDSIPMGVDFREHLEQAVTRCQIFIAIIGPQWLNITDAEGRVRLQSSNDFVRVEIESALKRDIPVIPLLISGATMPTEEALPESLIQLAYQNGRPVRLDPDFHRDMDRVITSLKQYLSQ